MKTDAILNQRPIDTIDNLQAQRRAVYHLMKLVDPQQLQQQSIDLPAVADLLEMLDDIDDQARQQLKG